MGVFDCSLPLTDADKEKIIEVVRMRFGKIEHEHSEKSVRVSLTSEGIVQLAQQLSQETNVNTLEQTISDLQTLCEIARNRLEILDKMKTISGGKNDDKQI